MSTSNDYPTLPKEGDVEAATTPEQPQEVKSEDTILVGKQLAVVFVAM